MAAQTVLLGDICDVRDGTHDSPKPKEIGHPLVTSKHIKNYKIDFSTANLISKEDFEAVNKRSKVDKYDILISMIGTVGELALIDYEPTFAIKNIGLIKTGDELLGKYLFYYLQSTKAKQYIEASLAGSTQKFIGLGQLRKFPIELPDLETQKKIADILGTIDEKIELNRRMNETLEQMGQALFRHYFIDSPEAEKWEEGTLEDLFEITMGQSPPGSSYNEDGEGITFYQGRAEFGVRFPNKRLSTIDPKRLAKRGDVLLSVRAPVGDINQADENCCIGRGLAAISGGAGKTSFCYYTCRSIQGRLAEYNSEGTVFGAINGKQLKSLNVKLPPETIIKSFEEQAQGLDEQILNNSQQIQTLTTLRDTLLPRLISGKVKI